MIIRDALEADLPAIVAIYNEGIPFEDCDLLATATTYPLLIRGYQAAVARMA